MASLLFPTRQCAFGLALLFLLLPPPAKSQSVCSEPVGFVRTSCLSNSDTFCGLPLTRPAAFRGLISSASKGVLAISGTPGWSTNRFSGTQAHYALIGTHSSTNPNEGRIYRITTNGAASLTLELNGDSIDAISPNTPVSVFPYWTLATLFPDSDANISFTPSASSLSIKTQILIPDYNTTGINLAAAKAYYYLNSGTNIGWRKSGDAITTDHGSDILLPDGYVIVRNKNNAPTLPMRICGSVLTGKQTTGLDTSATSKQDNSIALIRPIDLPLQSTGLSPAAGNFVASQSALSIQDQLLCFDNAQVAMNKSASKSYYYLSNGTSTGWRLAGAPVTEDRGRDLLPAGSALLIRKAVADGATRFLTNSPTY